jgi:hypothetical protein
VFLSYSRRDAGFVGRLADDLMTRGIDSWLDTDDLPTEDEDRWRRSVVQGIRESDAIILVLSPDSVRSAAVERELTIGAEMTRRIIPIMHRRCTLSDGVMFELAGLQRTDFVDQPYEVALDELVNRIHAGPARQADVTAPANERLGGSGDHHRAAPERDQEGDTGSAHVPVDVGSIGDVEGDQAADSKVQSQIHAAPNDLPQRTIDRSGTRGGRWLVVAAVVSLIATVLALLGIRLLRDDGAGHDDARSAAPTATEHAGITTEPAGGVLPAGSTPGATERSTLVPWDVATATLERRDGTTATVNATSLALACNTGNLRFENGQTISLELVASIQFDAINPDNSSADGVVTLLDGRELTDPIDTWNCPIHGTAELGPIDIQLDDIQRIDLNRDAAALAGAEPAGGVVPAGSAPGATERSTLVPWDVATATLERRDGTTATVNATSLALACNTGNLRFENGQTISLELVASIQFDAINPDNSSADGVVKLLDGRELTDPIDTWNCPIHGTTELGPIDIQLDDIQRIDLNR